MLAILLVTVFVIIVFSYGKFTFTQRRELISLLMVMQLPFSVYLLNQQFSLTMKRSGEVWFTLVVWIIVSLYIAWENYRQSQR